MTTSSQAPLSLPSTFPNSFWPAYPSYPSYRSAVSHLFTILQHGIDEDASLVQYVKLLIEAQYDLVDTLRRSTDKIDTIVAKDKPIFKGSRPGPTDTSTPLLGTGSSTPAGTTKYLIKALHNAATEPLAASHVRTAMQLQRGILDPFSEWSAAHRERIQDSWTTLEQWLDQFEAGQDDLDRLKAAYEAKCRQADEAEEDARFSGVNVSEGDESLLADQEQPTIVSSSQRDSSDLSASSSLPSSMATMVDKPEEEEDLDPAKIERRQTLRKQFGFSARKASTGAEAREAMAPAVTSATSSPQQPAKIGPSSSAPSSPSKGASLKRTGTISAALTSALAAPALQGIKDRISAAAGAGGIAEKWKRLRGEADQLEADYIKKARQLDTVRCRLEDVMSDQLTVLQKYEFDRLSAIKTAMQTYTSAYGSLHPSLMGRLQPLLSTQDPAILMPRLIASARTGYYRPQPEVFHPVYHDECGSSNFRVLGFGTGWAGFGTHLNARWRSEIISRHSDEASLKPPASPAPNLPLVFSHLLSSIERAHEDATLWPVPTEASDSNDHAITVDQANIEKRKSWIYDVPLKSAHACRESIISHTLSSSHPGAELGAGLPAVLDFFDPPTKAMTLKVWLAELQESLIPEENWHMISSLYKAAESVEGKWRHEQAEKKAGKTKESEASSADTQAKGLPPSIELDDQIKAEIKRGIIEDLSVVLSKLSTIHLAVLDSLLLHLRNLINKTPTSSESDSAYVNKLGLSLGRFLLRPTQTTQSTMSSPIPTLLVIDLLTHYEVLLPPALQRKSKQEDEVQVAKRKMPTRKRTKPMDARIRRSQLYETSSGQTPSVPALPKIVTESKHLSAAPLPRSESPEDAPTPIAERVLGGAPAMKSSAALSESTLAAPSSGLSRPSSANGRPPSSAGGSSYGTPTEEVEVPRWNQSEQQQQQAIEPTNEITYHEEPEDADTPTNRFSGGIAQVAERLKDGAEKVKNKVVPTTTATTATSSSRSSSPVKPSYSSGRSTPLSPPATSSSLNEPDEDQPLSNVARLSRRFGTGGAIGGVRGPRPAGSRSSQHGPPSSSG